MAAWEDIFFPLFRGLVRAIDDISEMKESMKRMEFCIVALTGLVYTVVVLGVIGVIFHLCRLRFTSPASDDNLSYMGSHGNLGSSRAVTPDQHRKSSVAETQRYTTKFYKPDLPPPSVVIRENKNQIIEPAPLPTEEMI